MDLDVWLTAVDGSTPLVALNLSAAEGDASQAQFEPSTDTDGHHFAVAYTQADVSGATNFNTYVTDVAFADAALVVTEARQPLSTAFGSDRHPEIASIQSSWGFGFGRRYFASWERFDPSGQGDVFGALYDSRIGGPVTPFCFGSTSCPCGAAGAPGHGCPNSVNAAGGLLSATGNAALGSDDTLVLEASDLPASTTCLFFQGTGTAPAPGTAFGDGLRCVSGTQIRLGTKATSAGIARYPEMGDVAISVKGALPSFGGVRHYQTWYRNAAAFCTAATFNVTSGVTAVWTR
jgi:hypothetical protein